ncbi:EscE/YscE/SsaE family type III secretion system needle protein co-chaperone [Salmonella enterica]|nr:EscE/YscE/SsaE family type III secretion system needle protein co-chaperone [Salmonella enterica]
MMSLTELEDMLIEDTENNSEKLLSILKEKRKQLNKSLETPLDKLACNKTEQMLVACEAAQQVIELIAFRFSNNKKRRCQ